MIDLLAATRLVAMLRSPNGLGVAGCNTGVRRLLLWLIVFCEVPWKGFDLGGLLVQYGWGDEPLRASVEMVGVGGG